MFSGMFLGVCGLRYEGLRMSVLGVIEGPK